MALELDTFGASSYFTGIDAYELNKPQKYKNARKVFKPFRRPSKSKYSSTIDESGFFNFVTYSWLSNAVYKSRNEINLEDFPNISEHDLPLRNAARLYRLCQEQVKKDGKVNLSSVFLRSIRTRLIMAVFSATLYLSVHILGPALIINQLIRHISSPSPSIGFGIGLCFAFLLSDVLRVIFYHTTWNIGIRTGLRSRAAVLALMFRKISNLRSLEDKTMGQIINLLTNDSQRIFEMNLFIAFALAAPFGLIAATILGFFFVGWTIIIGIVFYLLFIPYQIGLAKWQVHFRRKSIVLTDKRVKMISEILNCIKLIKLYAWEGSFIQVLEIIRQKERSILLKMGMIQTVQNATVIIAPAVGCALSLLLHTLLGYPLTAAQAFAVVAIFNSLRIVSVFLPMALKGAAESVVAFKRYDEVLGMVEMTEYSTSIQDAANSVEVNQISVVVAINIPKDQNAEFKAKEKQLLKDINLNIPKGSLVGICGTIGSGKSCLISTILGQLPHQSGSIGLNGSMCYVPQQAWIFHASVRENILFGMPWDEDKYNKVLKLCCLEQDIEAFPSGDQTEVGERGINLSGGQKQRISLARAVYSERDIVLLDDPLSAVDAHVGKHIFFECIKKALSDKTIIFVTHQLQYLKDCDHVVWMVNGRIQKQGHHMDLMNEKDYMKMITNHEANSGNSTKENVKNLDSNGFIRKNSFTEIGNLTDKNETRNNKISPSPLVEEETRSFGQVKWATYKAHMQAMGGYWVFLSVYVVVGISVACTKGADWWLSVWINQGGEALFFYFNVFLSLACLCDDLCIYKVLTTCKNVTLSVGNVTLDCISAPSLNISTNPRIQINQIIYGSIVVGALVSIALRCLTFAPAMLKASTHLHNTLLHVIMKCPSSFFDRTPTGRLLNRFSQDVDEMDARLPTILQSAFQQSWLLLVVVGSIVVVFPHFLVAIVVFGILFLILFRVYRSGVREFKRIENIYRSPMISHLTATLQGLSTIHAYDKTKDYVDRFIHLFVNHYQSMQAYWFSLQWITVRLEVINISTNFIVAILTAVAASYPAAFGFLASTAFAGLTLTFSFQITGLLQIFVRFLIELQAMYTSVERVRDYITNCPSEASDTSTLVSPHPSWPENGRIKFQNVSMQYRDGLPQVLTDVNFEIQPKEKIGIVGRTGSGKSSLGVVLFRLVEVMSGRIEVDGVDVSTVGLEDLRSKMSIIPQDPVLFIGTIRYNLDPFNRHSDEEIWRAIKVSHIEHLISQLPDKLETEVVENGENFSVGERQLLCMARAILRHSKIIMLDEATAAIDSETDSLVQDTIREAFADCTMLTIAHRLNTVLTSDKILVMDDGKVVEFGKTEELMLDHNSRFYQMLHTSDAQGQGMKSILENSIKDTTPSDSNIPDQISGRDNQAFTTDK